MGPLKGWRFWAEMCRGAKARRKHMVGWGAGERTDVRGQGRGVGWLPLLRGRGASLICTDTLWPAVPAPQVWLGPALFRTLRLLPYLDEAQPRYLPSAGADLKGCETAAKPREQFGSCCPAWFVCCWHDRALCAGTGSLLWLRASVIPPSTPHHTHRQLGVGPWRVSAKWQGGTAAPPRSRAAAVTAGPAGQGFGTASGTAGRASTHAAGQGAMACLTPVLTHPFCRDTFPRPAV